MAAVRNLCSRVVEIEAGNVVTDGPPDETVGAYIANELATGGAVLNLPRPLGNPDELVITAVRVADEDGRTEGPFHSSRPVGVEIDIDVARQNAAYQVGFDLLSPDGHVLRSWHTDGPPDGWPSIRTGSSTLRCVLPAGLLNEGRYAVAPRADVYKSHWIANGDDAIWFEVVKDHLESPFAWVSNPGVLAPLLDWHVRAGPTSPVAQVQDER